MSRPSSATEVANYDSCQFDLSHATHWSTTHKAIHFPPSKFQQRQNLLTEGRVHTLSIAGTNPDQHFRSQMFSPNAQEKVP